LIEGGPVLDYRDGEDVDEISHAAPLADFAVGSSVRVYPGTSDERWGIIVDDFGDDVGYGVDIGSPHIVDASRRWAITVDGGNLVFVDSSELANHEGQRPEDL
jgi:hypothetical protein